VRYRNFDIEVTDYEHVSELEHFRVRVLRSPEGPMNAAAAAPGTIDDALRAQVGLLDARQLSIPRIKALGTALGARMFPPPVRTLLRDSLKRLAGPDEGLRIRLRFEAPELARYPWEFCYLPETEDGEILVTTRFLALDRKLSIVRCSTLPDDAIRLSAFTNGRVEMAAVFASPSPGGEYSPLDVEAEQAAIAAATANTPLLHVTAYPHGNVAELQQAIAADPHVLHFAGHGDFEQPDPQTPPRGFVVLNGVDDGPLVFLNADALAANFRGRRTRLVVLGSCSTAQRDRGTAWSGVATALVSAGVPAAIGMQFSVTDRNAILFASRLYKQIAQGASVDTALVDARLAITNSNPNDPYFFCDFGTPVLYLEAHDGDLFPRTSAADAADDDETWQRLRDSAATQLERTLQRYRGADGKRGIYLPDCYVPRERIDAVFASFSTSEARALLLVDEVGAGKSTALCRWAEQLRDDGHLVFLYDAGTSLHNGLAFDLANDLALRSPSMLDDVLERAERLAGDRGKRLVLIVDAINDFRGVRDDGVECLLYELDAFAMRTTWTHVRVIGACGSSAWNRLSRAGLLRRLSSSSYFQGDAGRPVVPLGPFSPDEAAAAYTSYAKQFVLATPHDRLSLNSRARLRRPVLLRLVAEVFGGTGTSLTDTDITVGILERLVRERLPSANDAILAERVAARMWGAGRIALRVDELASDPDFRDALAPRDDADAWRSLQDHDLLRIEVGDPLIGDTVQFSYAELGSFFLARFLMRKNRIDAATITGLVGDARLFPLAWEAARRSLLLTTDGGALITALAGSALADVRELVSDTIVALYSTDPSRARALVQSLVVADDADRRRVALKVAFLLGPAMRDILLDAAGDTSESVRDDVRDVLYLIWQNEELEVRPAPDESLVALWREQPGFTEQFLDDLLGRITPLTAASKLIGRGELLTFFITMTIAIYINHCDRQDVIDHTVRWYRRLALERLHIDAIDKPGIVNRAAQRFIMNALYRKYGSQVLDALRLRGVEDGKDPFDATLADRAIVQRVFPATDPSATLLDYADDLVRMLDADVPAFRILAAIPLAVHAYANPDRALPILDAMRGRLSPRARLWQLLSLSVFARDTPESWIPLLESWTTDLLTRDVALFRRDEKSLLVAFDVSLVPLALALSKRGQPLTLYTTQLAATAASHDEVMSLRLIEALGNVGYYCPRPTLDVFAACNTALTTPAQREALETALGIMRASHADAVDGFIEQQGLGEAAARRIAMQSNPELLRKLIWYLGLYSHGVYASRHYPRMRSTIVASAYKLLATVESPVAFGLAYSEVAGNLFRQSKYDLTEWMKQEPWPA